MLSCPIRAHGRNARASFGFIVFSSAPGPPSIRCSNAKWNNNGFDQQSLTGSKIPIYINTKQINPRPRVEICLVPRWEIIYMSVYIGDYRHCTIMRHPMTDESPGDGQNRLVETAINLIQVGWVNFGLHPFLITVFAPDGDGAELKSGFPFYVDPVESDEQYVQTLDKISSLSRFSSMTISFCKASEYRKEVSPVALKARLDSDGGDAAVTFPFSGNVDIDRLKAGLTERTGTPDVKI